MEPIIERAMYYADKIRDDDMLDSEAVAIGATLAVGETNIIIINLLTQLMKPPVIAKMPELKE